MRLRRAFKAILFVFVIVPFWVNFLLHVYAWFFVLDQGGIINILCWMLGIIDEPLHLLNSMFGLCCMVYCYLPFHGASPSNLLLALIVCFFRGISLTFLQHILKLGITLSCASDFGGCLRPAGYFIPSFGEFAILGSWEVKSLCLSDLSLHSMH